MPPKEKATRAAAFSVAAASAALTLTACAALTTGSAQDNTPGEISTDIGDAEATLTLAFADDPPTHELVQGFTSRYPNVTVELQQTQFTDYVKTISLSMTSDDAPDIAQYNPGAMRSLIPGGHILDLDPYAEAYGWDESFPAASLEPLRSDDAASEFATGSLYAAPGALSVLGVFYNTALLEEAGVPEPPATLEDFETALELADQADIAPLSVGGLEVGGFQIWNALLNVLGDHGEYKDWVYGAAGSTIETDAAAEATETFHRWVEAGYVPESANATSDNDARAAFVDGDGMFLVTGNWAAFELEAEMGDDVGFMLMPGTTVDQTPVASGASVAYAVSSHTDHPDVAAAFLDYLSGVEAAEIQLSTGFMPVDTQAPTESRGLLGEVNSGFGTVADNEGIVPFPDYATPGMIDQLTPGVQGLISGSATPEEFLASLQAEWESHHE
ncbi:ABC transporter substrate-binding protein [Nocardiopsis sp. NPDC006938]|uniref:ABC transporter substrate-binding protein n=1 Tax=Nocardiopsis sp. NPDC006938 TaxID=3364337 RepID=UPI003694A81C